MKLFLWAVALVLLCAAPPVFANEEPPLVLQNYVNALPEHMAGQEITCSGTKHHKVPCRIFLDKERKLVYFCLYDGKGDITHVIVIGEDKKEIPIWTRSDQTI